MTHALFSTHFTSFAEMVSRFAAHRALVLTHFQFYLSLRGRTATHRSKLRLS
ncbi:hypothetical protein C8J57DRAFT_1470804 [Mycena rebaudengoi]|nr:hypothetical protein C8J57DRAFT_1470804 [Mycena rebaudengoi]